MSSFRLLPEGDYGGGGAFGQPEGREEQKTSLRPPGGLDFSPRQSDGRCMSLAQIKEQVTKLEANEQRELIAFLISRKRELGEEERREFARKIDDNDPARWVDLDEVEKRLAE